MAQRGLIGRVSRPFAPQPGFFTISTSLRRSGRHRFATVAAVQTAPTKLQEDLKDKLIQEIKKVPEIQRNGKPLPPVQVALDQIKAAAEENDPFQVEPSVINGVFEGLMNSSVLIEGDGSISIGALTFQQFGPKELKIFLDPGTGGLYQGVDSPDEYAVRTGFRVGEGKHEGLLGLWSVLGTYSVDSNKLDRQITSFTGIRMEPIDKSPEGMQAWMDLMQSSNPGMDEQGVVKGSFPQAIRGHRDFIYLDQDTQVTIGNRGAFVVSVRKE